MTKEYLIEWKTHKLEEAKSELENRERMIAKAKTVSEAEEILKSIRRCEKEVDILKEVLEVLSLLD